MRPFLPSLLFPLLVVTTFCEEAPDDDYYRIEWDCYESKYEYERKESTFPSDFDDALDRSDLYYPDDYLPFDEVFTNEATVNQTTTSSSIEDEDDVPSRKVGIGGRRGKKRGGGSTSKIGGGSSASKWLGGSRKPDLRKPGGFNGIKTPGMTTNRGGGFRTSGGGGFHKGSFGEFGQKTSGPGKFKGSFGEYGNKINQKGNKFGGSFGGSGQKRPGLTGKGNKKTVQPADRVRGGAGGFEKGPFTNRGGQKLPTGLKTPKVKTPGGYRGNDNKPTRPGQRIRTGTENTKTGGAKKPGGITKVKTGKIKETTPGRNGGRQPTTRFKGGTTPKGWTGRSTKPPPRSSSSSKKKITPRGGRVTTPSGRETTGGGASTKYGDKSTPFHKGNRANRTNTKRPPNDRSDMDTGTVTVSTRGTKHRNRTRTSKSGSTVSTPTRPGAKANRTSTTRMPSGDDTATMPIHSFTPRPSASAEEPRAPLPMPSITADAGQSASGSDEASGVNNEEGPATRRTRAPERDCNEVFSEAEQRGEFQKGSAIDNRFQQCKSLGSRVWDSMKRGTMKLFVKEGETPADAVQRYAQLGIDAATELGKTWIQTKLTAPTVPRQTAEEAAAVRAKEAREAQEAALAATAAPVEEPNEEPVQDGTPAEETQEEAPAEDSQQEAEEPAGEISQEESSEPADGGSEEAQADEAPQEGDQGDASEAGEEQQEEGQGEGSQEENEGGGEESAEESPQDEGDGFPVQDVPEQDVPFQEIPEQEIPSQDYPTGYIS